LLFSAAISEHFSKNRMIISAVAAKIWYRKNVRFLLGHPVVKHHNVRPTCIIITSDYPCWVVIRD